MTTLLDISERGLPAFRDALIKTVSRLERAFAEGVLEEAVDEMERAGRLTPDLSGVYRRLLTVPDDVLRCAASFRAGTVGAVLDEADAQLREPRQRFVAEPVFSNASNDEKATARAGVRAVKARGPAGDVEIRVRRLVALRNWRIGFDVADPIASTLIDRAIAGGVTGRVISGLSSIVKIAHWFSRRPGAVLPETITGPGIGRDFEQLILDILNEHQDIASHASLFEDFAEKTDLRVNLAEPYRRNGARAQVTLTCNPAEVEVKRASIRHGGSEMIFISPLTLAEALSSEDLTSGDERADILGALRTASTDIYALATRLRNAFLDAIESPRLDPRGPLAYVPEEIRSFVRRFVAQEASLRTSEMRSRQKRMTVRQ